MWKVPLTFIFIDLRRTLTHSSINRKVMFALWHYGITEPLVNVQCYRGIYSNSKRKYSDDGGNIMDSDPFEVSTDILQDEVLTPFLSIILVDYLLETKQATLDLDLGVVNHPCHSRRYHCYPVQKCSTSTSLIISIRIRSDH